MGNEDDVARIINEMLFEPGDAFGVEVVGRFVEQQDRRLFEQQPGQRDAALFTARQAFDAPVARRTTQRFHRDFELVVERPAVDRVDLFLQLAHFGHQRVEVGVLGRIGHQRADLVEAIEHVGDGADAVHDIFLHRLRRIEFGFLRQIAEGNPLARPRFAGEIGIDARHDFHQRRLAGAVGPDDADLRIRIELQIDAVEHRLLRAGIGLGQTLHHETILGGHEMLRNWLSRAARGRKRMRSRAG